MILKQHFLFGHIVSVIIFRIKSCWTIQHTTLILYIRLIYLQPDEINLAQGTRIRIHGGEFNGYEGVFIKLKGKRNKRVVVDIDNLIALAVEISPELIEVIKE